MKIEDIKVKKAADLTDDEKGFLKEHSDDLSESEREEFKEVLEPKEEEFGFGSKEEFNKAVAEGVETSLEARKKARAAEKIKKAAKKEGVDFSGLFTEEPKDWGEALSRIYPEFEKKITGSVIDALKTQAKERQDRMATIEKEYDVEVVQIRKDNPEMPKRGTKEGDQFEEELADIGNKYKGVTNMTEAYEIWKVTKGKPGGVGTRQRGLARKIGKGKGAPVKAKARPYRELAGKRMDELLEERMAEEGIEPA